MKYTVINLKRIGIRIKGIKVFLAANWLIFCIVFGLMLICSYFFFQNLGKNNSHVVIISESGFTPKYLRIEKGDKVIFQNKGRRDSWPASNIHPSHEIYPEFDSKKALTTGTSWDFKFSNAGEWRYHDHLNALITGTIAVQQDEESESSEMMVNALTEEINRYVLLFQSSVLSGYFRVFPDQKNSLLNLFNIKKLIDQKSDNVLLLLIKLYGPNQVTWHLSEQSEKGSKFDCHQYAHHIGRLAFRVLGKDALKRNITFCHSGYHHGVIAMFVKGISSDEVMKKVEEVCKEVGTEFNALTCFHGAGHGMLAYLDYDLPQTLEECKKVQTSWRQSSCMAGAFMENISTEFGDSLESHRSQWVNKNDEHYPCNVLNNDLQAQKACYSIQPIWMAYLFKYDMNKLVDSCAGLKEELRGRCMFGYGQVIGLITNYDPSAAAEYCKKLPDGNSVKSACVTGILMGLMDSWASNMGNKGDLYCQSVAITTRNSCYEFLESRKQELTRLFNN